MSNAESTIQIAQEPSINKPTIISSEEKNRRAGALADAVASVELEGFLVEEEYKTEAQRFVNGEIELSALTQTVDELITKIMHNSDQLISTEERQRREDAVDFATASIGLDGFKLSPEAVAHAQRYINGEIDLEKYLAISFQDTLTDEHFVRIFNLRK